MLYLWIFADVMLFIATAQQAVYINRVGETFNDLFEFSLRLVMLLGTGLGTFIIFLMVLKNA